MTWHSLIGQDNYGLSPSNHTEYFPHWQQKFHGQNFRKILIEASAKLFVLLSLSLSLCPNFYKILSWERDFEETIPMDQIMNKMGSYWIGKRASKELDSVGDDINVRAVSILKFVFSPIDLFIELLSLLSSLDFWMWVLINLV